MITAKCKRCGNEIVQLNFSEEQKLEIWGLLIQDLKLFAIKKIIDEHNYSHRNAKIIFDHLNKEFGKCNRCNFADLKEENIECPKCKAFNYNLKINYPFNKDFCTYLEFKLDFDQLEDENLKVFWCDGISHIPADIKSLSQAKIEKDKQIKTKAWIGTDGQDIYEMTISFGEKVIKNYKNDLSLIECIPNDNYPEWIKIQPDQKTIEVKLK